ncbi:hypothetical protein Acr_10g0007750 [Actinidia rufa]|uniref:Uncharacterized protein n=1 Tax=Actinidia rufa TaxID=165716 RepID=A0A7J0F9L5_9ERIC|nr:hypothetical protein Acr_10g0007750 [Actinidia rufa]
MLSGVGWSGFEWDPDINMVSHKDASQWWNRNFPLYDTLCTVFGKDRATGKDVTAEDVLEELSRNEENVDKQNLGLGVGVEEVEHYISNASTNDEGNSHSVDLDIAVKMGKINEELRKLSNLSRIEYHRALLAIARDHGMTICFFTLEDVEKEDFLKTE